MLHFRRADMLDVVATDIIVRQTRSFPEQPVHENLSLDLTLSIVKNFMPTYN